MEEQTGVSPQGPALSLSFLSPLARPPSFTFIILIAHPVSPHSLWSWLWWLNFSVCLWPDVDSGEKRTCAFLPYMLACVGSGVCSKTPCCNKSWVNSKSAGGRGVTAGGQAPNSCLMSLQKNRPVLMSAPIFRLLTLQWWNSSHTNRVYCVHCLLNANVA